MRVLVEQTVRVAKQLLEKLPESRRPHLHVAMGGETSSDWYLHPEHPAIIVGTQDMLLSRALNRGYASARARWPLEFGLLNQDALWIMDEVQLMDVGLATSAQLQAFREQDQRKFLRPCHTWWMSATLQPKWLRSIDTIEHHEGWIQNPVTVPSPERNGGLWDIQKTLQTKEIDAQKHKDFAKLILEEHSRLPDSEFGRITLVICNTVARACQTYEALRKAGRKQELVLVHSRFRPHERKDWSERFLSRAACQAGVDRIIVATQVVEAGVDISAGCLVTELAPWPSLVQRFGRCARYAGMGHVTVVNRWPSEDGSFESAKTGPYQPAEMEGAWEALTQIAEVGLRSLEDYEESLSSEGRERLYPYSPPHLLMRVEFDELFDTTPDLTGGDLDISRFIRSDEEDRDLQVFWLQLTKDEKPSEDHRPRREELCTIPFLGAREWLCEPKKSKLKVTKRAWIWDWLDGEWKTATRESLTPGRIVCVASNCGGYRLDLGFDPKAEDPVLPVPSPDTGAPLDSADDRQDSEQQSFSPWKTIACHTAEVVEQVRQISEQLGLPKDLRGILELAAWWHDWGKAHAAFQGSIRDSKDPKVIRLPRQDLAKAPQSCWSKQHLYQMLDDSDRRPGFRHELASALGLFSILASYYPQHAALLGPWTEVLAKLVPSAVTYGISKPPQMTPLISELLSCTAEEFDLVVYLVASHHGKVRVALHASPKDQEYRDRDGRGLPIRGIREGDSIPEVVLRSGELPIPTVNLTLSPASLGLSPQTGRSWRERCISLTRSHSPGTLAFLEAILCAADRRASALKTEDPVLRAEVQA